MSAPAEVLFTQPTEWQLPDSDAAPTPDDLRTPFKPWQPPVCDAVPMIEDLLTSLEPAMSTGDSRVDTEPATPTLECKAYFRVLAKVWKRDTSHLSLVSQRITHPAYKQILSMGKTALPLILAELSVEPDHWFHALSLLADDNPIPSGFCGTVSEAAELWLDWGRKQNLNPDAAERSLPDIP